MNCYLSARKLKQCRTNGGDQLTISAAPIRIANTELNPTLHKQFRIYYILLTIVKGMMLCIVKSVVRSTYL